MCSRRKSAWTPDYRRRIPRELFRTVGKVSQDTAPDNRIRKAAPSRKEAAVDGTHIAKSHRGAFTMIRITETIVFDDREIRERFVRSAGAGHENIHRDATAVELRLDIGRC
jgi:hypothetical protein